MNELPFRGSSSSYSRNIVPRANRATTEDEGPKTKKRKLDDAKTSEQQKSVKIQKLQKAISSLERTVERYDKEKERRAILIFFDFVIFENGQLHTRNDVKYAYVVFTFDNRTTILCLCVKLSP